MNILELVTVMYMTNMESILLLKDYDLTKKSDDTVPFSKGNKKISWHQQYVEMTSSTVIFWWM